jgi:chromosome segregation ATPase
MEQNLDERFEKLMEKLRVVLSHKRALAHENARLVSQIDDIKTDIKLQQMRLDDITGKVTPKLPVKKAIMSDKKDTVKKISGVSKRKDKDHPTLTRSNSSSNLVKSKSIIFSTWK